MTEALEFLARALIAAALLAALELHAILKRRLG